MEFQRDEAGVVDTIIFHQPNGHLSGAADLRLISETRRNFCRTAGFRLQ